MTQNTEPSLDPEMFNWVELLTKKVNQDLKTETMLQQVSVNIEGKDYVFNVSPLGISSVLTALILSLVALKNDKVNEILRQFKVVVKDINNNTVFS
jgi:hypothetical protein